MRSVDDMIGKLVGTLQATGELRDTYFVFSSDNGLHMGDHRLMPGKLTAFDTDINVPLIVVGPACAGATGPRRLPRTSTCARRSMPLPGPSRPSCGRPQPGPLLSTTPAPTATQGLAAGALIEHLGPSTTTGP